MAFSRWFSQGMWQSVYVTVSLLLGQLTHKPETLEGYILTSGWIFTCFILAASFTAELASFLIVQRESSLVRCFRLVLYLFSCFRFTLCIYFFLALSPQASALDVVYGPSRAVRFRVLSDQSSSSHRVMCVSLFDYKSDDGDVPAENQAFIGRCRQVLPDLLCSFKRDPI